MRIRIKRLAAIFLITSLVASVASCSEGETSVSEETSSVVSETFQLQDDIKSEDDESVVSETEESDFSEDASTASEDVSYEESSEEIISGESSEEIISGESSEDLSVDASLDNSEDISDNISNEISDVSTEESSTDFSEDVSDTSSSVVDDFMAELLEKYKDVDSIKALAALDNKYSKKMKISLNAPIEGMNNTYIAVEGYMNHSDGDMKFVFDCDVIFMGNKMLDIKMLCFGEDIYLIDDYLKEYCVISGDGEEIPSIDNSIFENVTVKTENQLIEGVIYKTDWFIIPEQNQVGIFTKDGKIEFLSILVKMNQVQTPILFDVEIEGYDSSVDFTIPDGYSEVSQENFKIGVLG